MTKETKMKAYVSLPLAAVRYGKVRPDWAEGDVHDRRVDFWLRKRIGFYPNTLYFAASDLIAAQFSGYTSQWRRWWHDVNEDGKLVKVHETKGEPVNRVLAVFAVDSLADPVFIDYDAFGEVVNTVGNRWESEYPLVRAEQCVFKRSWNKARWLRYAEKNPFWAAALVPHHDLRQAMELWVRNEATKRELEAMGFKNVLVKRYPVQRSW